jgi:uncharacterized membrane protein
MDSGFSISTGALWILSAVVYVAPVALVIWLVWAVRNLQRREHEPRAVLAERLARGEITKDGFETAMRALGWPKPPT